MHEHNLPPRQCTHVSDPICLRGRKIYPTDETHYVDHDMPHDQFVTISKYLERARMRGENA